MSKISKKDDVFYERPLISYLTFPSEKLSLRSQQLGWPVSIFIEQTFHTVNLFVKLEKLMQYL